MDISFLVSVLCDLSCQCGCKVIEVCSHEIRTVYLRQKHCGFGHIPLALNSLESVTCKQQNIFVVAGTCLMALCLLTSELRKQALQLKVLFILLLSALATVYTL